MINYKLHHLGILCDDVAAMTHFYTAVLQHEITARYYYRGAYDLTFLGSGSELLLELVGRPFSQGEQTHFDKHGAGFHHLAFQVEDADAAFADLQSKGLRVAWEPDDFLFVRHFGVYDNNGIVIEILEEKEPLARPQGKAPAPFKLHHFDIFSRDWRQTKQFYAENFGFRSVFEYIYESKGAFIYLADPFFDSEHRQLLLEVIGPPYEEPRELEFANRHGAGLDHVGYEVQDVGQAYRMGVEQGAKEFVRPYRAYDSEMGWLQDPNGGDLELMLPLLKEALQVAFLDKRPYQPAHQESE